jgi:hypothetical protein
VGVKDGKDDACAATARKADTTQQTNILQLQEEVHTIVTESASTAYLVIGGILSSDNFAG